MLKVNQITKKYNTVKAVDSLSFEVSKGEIFALLEPNGAGKTSTVRMIMQIIKPDSGNITFDGSITSGGKLIRSQLGYLPEERGLYQDVPVINVLKYLASLRGVEPLVASQRAQHWLERLSLWDRRNEKISSLSKGNQQKVQFIASVLHKPQFAILDEPFSGFDPINQELVSNLIKELRDEGMTILLSAHQMQLVERLADKIMLLNKGKTHIEGTLAEIKKAHSSNAFIHIQYAHPVSEDLLKHVPGVVGLDTNDTHSEFTIYIGQGTNLNEIMKNLMEHGEITSFSNQAIGLHDIFVQTIK